MAKSKNRNQRGNDLDLAMALALHQEYKTVGGTENAAFRGDKNKENYQPRTLPDQTLDIDDPTSHIYTLFIQFNTRFFKNKLLSSEVKWKERMTSCAGDCSFHPRSRKCVISLSAPLLKLRPRKDLVKTLLHEMIHGYLFLTNNNQDRSDHGPEFCKHMDKINRKAGTQITIYHNFQDENIVRLDNLHQQHLWKCDGPCQRYFIHPYFGTSAQMKSHQLICDGELIKVHEPEKTKGEPKSQKTLAGMEKPSSSPQGQNVKSVNHFFTKPQVNPKAVTTNVALTVGAKYNIYNPRKNLATSTSVPPAGLVKLGTAGVVGGVGTGRSNLLDKFSSSPAISGSRPPKKHVSTIIVDKPPIKETKIASSTFIVNSPNKKDKLSVIENTSSLDKSEFMRGVRGTSTPMQSRLGKFVTSPKRTATKHVPCPVCNKTFEMDLLNGHLDNCPTEPKEAKNRAKYVSKKRNPLAGPGGGKKSANVVDLTDGAASKESYVCRVCNSKISGVISLNEHLDECVQGLFNGVSIYDE